MKAHVEVSDLMWCGVMLKWSSFIRFNLPYVTLFGGVVSILADQFVAANGMSNSYFGWGAEDDDFYQRLDSVQLIPCRLQPDVSKYVMMKHKPEAARYFFFNRCKIDGYLILLFLF